jgi:hypothetical protein
MEEELWDWPEGSAGAWEGWLGNPGEGLQAGWGLD